MTNIKKLSGGKNSNKVKRVGRPRTRKPKPGQVQQMSISLDGAIVQQIDDELDKMNADHTGPVWTRSDVVRVAVKEWLATRRGGK